MRSIVILAIATGTSVEVVKAMALLHYAPADADLVRSAITMGKQWQLSRQDALMVAAATGADVIASSPRT